MNELLSKLPDRIQNRINIQPNGCWFWTGAIDKSGYGRIQFKGRNRVAHRVIRFLTRKDIPLQVTSKTILDHEPHCGVRKCVNPFHTNKTSVRNNLLTSKHVSGETSRTQVCQRGHDLADSSNVYVYNGIKTCKVCRDMRSKQYRNVEA